jgi:hypothetical protein
LRRRQTQFGQIVFQFLVRLQTETEKTDPEASCVRCKERTFERYHALDFSRSVWKNQLR